MSGTYQGYYDTVKFDRAATTTLAKLIREVDDAYMRDYPFPAQLKAGGKVLYNQGGAGMHWDVRFTIHDPRAVSGAGVRDWKAKNLWKKANLGYKAYEVTDTLSKREVLDNSESDTQVVNLMDGFLERLKESFEIWLSTQYFNDGAAIPEWWDGLESLFASNGTCDVTAAGAQRTKNAADLVAYPAATYAGISTQLGGAGGGAQIDGIWPTGKAEPARDFWTPIIMFGDSTNDAVTNSTDASTHTWQAQCLEVMSFAITHSMRFGSKKERLTTMLMDRTMYNEFKNRIRGKENVYRTAGQEDTSLLKIGFQDTLVHDGCEITMDAGLPYCTAYGFNWRNCELRCQTDQIFDQENGIWYDPDVNAHKAAVSTYSNLRFTGIRNFVKIVRNISQLT